jgi:hypothetical protein
MYVGAGNIEDWDIPHWTKATQLIFEEYEKCNREQKE